MKHFIATFHSHYGSIRYKKLCEKNALQAKMMPVPRSLSSSCGTCVSFFAEQYLLDEVTLEELEQIVEVLENGYVQVYVVET